jgi:hypothetical protein
VNNHAHDIQGEWKAFWGKQEYELEYPGNKGQGSPEVAPIDVKNSLGPKLIERGKSRTNKQNRKIRDLTVWFRLRGTNDAQRPEGMCKSRLSANTLFQSFPEPSFLLTESTWLSELP